MSRESLPYQPLHSCRTLLAGLAMAEHGANHGPARPSVDDLIKALCHDNQ